MKPIHQNGQSDALRISPQYTSKNWKALDEHKPVDWATAAEIVKDRLDGRFLRFATDCLRDQYSGFVVLAIDCLLVDPLLANDYLTRLAFEYRSKRQGKGNQGHRT